MSSPLGQERKLKSQAYSYSVATAISRGGFRSPSLSRCLPFISASEHRSISSRAVCTAQAE
jgi:hypothetical protein